MGCLRGGGGGGVGPGGGWERSGNFFDALQCLEFFSFCERC